MPPSATTVPQKSLGSQACENPRRSIGERRRLRSPASPRSLRACQSRVMDSDGYGYTSDDRTTARLLDDLRTFSPSGIERAAQGWERHARTNIDHFRSAEAAAIAAIEQAHLTSEWEALQRQILD